MEKKYVIKDVVDNEYWYGNYSDKSWTPSIAEAKMMDYKEDAERIIKETFIGMYLQIIKIYI